MFRERDWAGLRRQGRDRFIWLSGVAIWGVGTAVLWSAGVEWWESGFSWRQFSTQRWLQLAAPALLLFPLGGYWWGRWMWKVLDRRRGARERRGATRGPDRRKRG